MTVGAGDFELTRESLRRGIMVSSDYTVLQTI